MYSQQQKARMNEIKHKTAKLTNSFSPNRMAWHMSHSEHMVLKKRRLDCSLALPCVLCSSLSKISKGGEKLIQSIAFENATVSSLAFVPPTRPMMAKNW